jgi:hypothetical protein
VVGSTSNRTEDPATTDEMMILRTLLEKSSDADLREIIGFFEGLTGRS